MRTIDRIILHSTATKEGQYFDVNDIREWHINRGFTNVGYHYVIKLDGTIEDGRDIRSIGAHCKNYNANSIGVVYVGGTDREGKAKDTRTKEQKESLLKLIDELMIAYDLDIDDVYCHYQLGKTLCPSFSIEEFKKEYIQWKDLNITN